MAKHNANLDVHGSLRVRKRIENNLHVSKEVTASAFYIRGVGEVGLTTLQQAYDNGNGRIEATAIKPFVVTGEGDVTYINSPSTSAGDLVFTEDFGIKWVVGKNNGGNFRIKGPSGGSVFQIEPSAPQNSLTIQTDGYVTFGRGVGIGDTLNVANAVSAEAFYVRGVGELTVPQVTVKDGIHIFTDDTVSFNHNHFYLTKDSLGNPTVNLSESNPRPATSRAVLSKTTATSIVDDAAATTLSWEVENEDLGNWFNPASPTQLVVPAGVSNVRVTCKVGVASGTAAGANSYTTLSVLKNGTALVPNETHRLENISVSTVITVAFVNSRVLPVSPGDIFTLTIAVNSWGANPAIATGPTYFSIEAIS